MLSLSGYKQYGMPTAWNSYCLLYFNPLVAVLVILADRHMLFSSWHLNDNDNDNILFDHNIQIEIIMYNSLENQIINWSGDYY